MPGPRPDRRFLRATTATARACLTDRGSIAPGLRADLVLVDGDPLTGIHATRTIHRVRGAGTEQ
nr:hypothetical protein StreXyl84_65800 [Streptomyces sp. Xyl84]